MKNLTRKIPKLEQGKIKFQRKSSTVPIRLAPLDSVAENKRYVHVPSARGSCALNSGLIITGTIEGHRCDLSISGVVEGTITARSVLINETGKVSGHIRAEKIDIAGYFNGRIEAMHVNLLAGSLTDATIYHNELTIDPNASIRGLQPWRPPGYMRDLRENW